MQGRTRKTAAVGTAAFVLAGSAALAAPGTASAETITADCGDTVTAKPGDKIDTPFGLKTVTDGVTSLVGSLLSGLCKVTVNVVDTVVEPVPVVGAPVAGAVNGTVAGTTSGVTSTVKGAGDALSGNSGKQPAKPAPDPGKPATPGTSPQAPGTTGGIPASNSPVLHSVAFTFGGLPFTYTTAFAPMRDYSSVPYALAGLWAPSPGVRYGGQVPGYAPEYGVLGQNTQQSPKSEVSNAGSAEALPDGSRGPNTGLPMLLAVIALSGVSAALVRAWVLRATTP